VVEVYARAVFPKIFGRQWTPFRFGGGLTHLIVNSVVEELDSPRRSPRARRRRMHRGLAVPFSSLARRLTTALVVRPAHATGAVPGVSKSPSHLGMRPRRASMPPNKRARPAPGASPPASPATPGKATAAKRSRTSRPGVKPEANDSSALSFGEVRDVRAALAAMSARDPVLAGLIAEAGVLPRIAQCQAARAATHEPHRAFRALARAIVFQQLHGAAAATIFSRVAALAGAEADATRLTPESILAADETRLRACGLSQRKLEYLRGLAEAFTAAPEGGGLGDAALESASDADARAALVALRGVGPWTVDMFSMFHLNRADVLPVGDFGVRKGMMLAYGLNSMPSPAKMEAIAENWRPTRTLASFYMWHAADAAKKEKHTPETTGNKS